MILTRTYHVMEMYNVHQDALMPPLNVTSNDYSLGEKKLKAVSASASRDNNGIAPISLVNIDANNEQEINIDLGGLAVKAVTGRVLQSAKLQDHNYFENPQTVKPVAFSNTVVNGNNLTGKMPRFSVVVLTLK